MGKDDSPLTEKEVLETAADLVNGIIAEFYMRFFVIMEKRSPEMARDLKPDYEEWMRTYERAWRELRGNLRIRDLEKRLPNNRWWKLVREAVESIHGSRRFHPSAEEREEIEGGFREAVLKRLLGEDIH